jgi:type 1 glutamine amidotransferase
VLESSDLRSYDLCVFYVTVRSLTREQESNLANFVAEGKGFVGIHPSTVVSAENEKYIDMIGGRFVTHSHYHEFPVTIKDEHHPITQGVSDFRVSDELYVVDCDAEKVHILATTEWEGKEVSLAYTKTYGDGKVFYLALGHDMAAWKHEAFRKLLLQGTAWVVS